MCLAILHKVGAAPIAASDFTKWSDENPDGIGYAFVSHGRVEIAKFLPDEVTESRYVKGLDNVRFSDSALENAWTRYAETVTRATGPVILHFRYATHGTRAEDNTHPIRIRRGLAFAHNGIIPIQSHKRGDTRSDTVLFRDRVLYTLPPLFYLENESLAVIEKYIGDGSKLVFIDGEGRYAIANEKAGEWSGDKLTWYSRPVLRDREWAGAALSLKMECFDCGKMKYCSDGLCDDCEWAAYEKERAARAGSGAGGDEDDTPDLPPCACCGEANENERSPLCGDCDEAIFRAKNSPRGRLTL